MKKEERLTDNIYGEKPMYVGEKRITAIYEKCYALEDLMEKYDIKDLEELDKIVGQWKAMVDALPYNCRNNKALDVLKSKTHKFYVTAEDNRKDIVFLDFTLEECKFLSEALSEKGGES